MSMDPGLVARASLKFAVALILVLTAISIASSAQTFTTFLNFDQTNGANPYGTLIQGTDGNFYGTSQFGGTIGYGNVFKITPEGVATSIYSFCRKQDCPDGYEPIAGLVQGANGNLYGTTPGTVGTIFSLNSENALTTLYRFCSRPDCADGYDASSSLVLGADGNLYGTTSAGGKVSIPCREQYGSCGTVFKITPGGVLTTLRSFRGPDGAVPYAALVQGSDGNFYGTTQLGGAYTAGTVFRITPQGAITLLHSFNTTDGAGPTAALIQAKDGNFYGTTSTGGVYDKGTVFKISAHGVFTLLRSFDSTNGSLPYSGLVQATDGNFYGTTYGGRGTVFKLTPAGDLVTLHAFCSQSSCRDGADPYAGLVQATDGNLYGTTVLGGNYCYTGGSCGTVFKLSLDLP